MMALFSWYLTSRQEKADADLTDNLTENLAEQTSHIEGMWPIAKVRQNTQVQHQEYISNKQANLNYHNKPNKTLLP